MLGFEPRSTANHCAMPLSLYRNILLWPIPNVSTQENFDEKSCNYSQKTARFLTRRSLFELNAKWWNNQKLFSASGEATIISHSLTQSVKKVLQKNSGVGLSFDDYYWKIIQLNLVGQWQSPCLMLYEARPDGRGLIRTPNQANSCCCY